MSEPHHHHDDHAHAHAHAHSHGDDGHDHSHDLMPALQSLLYQQIDFDGIITLNEADPKSGAAVVNKTWAQRLDEAPELRSDSDEQLLMHVPFAGSVKLHAILIRASDSPSAPRKLSLIRNRDDLDFGTAAELTATQTVENPRSNEVVEIPLNRALWNMTTSINLFFEDNHGDGVEDVTRIEYLGFKGEHTALNREPVSVLYEAAANPSDHVAIQGMGKVGRAMPEQ